MARSKGLLGISGNFEPQIASPLDARMLVPTYAELILTVTWTANDGGIYAYKGMLVNVINDGTSSNNGIYKLNNIDYTNLSNWEKIGGSTLGFTPENVTNKAIDLLTLDNTKYPTTKAVNDGITLAISGLLNNGISGGIVPLSLTISNQLINSLQLISSGTYLIFYSFKFGTQTCSFTNPTSIEFTIKESISMTEYSSTNSFISTQTNYSGLLSNISNIFIYTTLGNNDILRAYVRINDLPSSGLIQSLPGTKSGNSMSFIKLY